MEDNHHCSGESLPPSTECFGRSSVLSPVNCEKVHGVTGTAKELCENGSMVKPHESATSLPKEVYVYRQDIVKCTKYEDMLGVVLEVSGDSDSDADLTDSSDVEDDEGKVSDSNGRRSGNVNSGIGNKGGDSLNESPSEVQVRVMWIDGSETTDNLGDIAVVDRELLHGDIVASVSDPTGQLGLVVDVNISVDLLAPTSETIKDISSRQLKRIRDFTTGDYVVYGPWLGRVDDVVDNVTVLLDDGSVCKVIKADPMKLKPVSKSIVADSGFPYYPGQRVRAVSSYVFKNSRWLSGSWKASNLEGTVTNVQAASIFVYWIASASTGTGNSSAVVPNEEQNPKNLTLLSCFAHSNWQLGDWCMLPSLQSPLSSSIGNVTTENADDSLTECRSDVACSTEQDGDTQMSVKCAESSELDPYVPVLDLKREHTRDQTYADDIIHDKGYNSVLDASADRSTSLQLAHNRASDSFVTENSNVGIFSSERKDAVCADTASDSDLAETAGINNNELQSGASSHPASVLSKEHAHESAVSRKKLRKVLIRREKKLHKREESFQRAFFVACTMTKVDVAWQDGTKEFGVDAKSLIPIQNPGDHEFFPEQYVAEQASNESDDSYEVKRVGVVKSINAKERTACVKWLKPVSRPEDLQEFDNEEVVSVYELAEHPDYDYCYGDLVVRLSPPSVSADGHISEDPVGEKDHSDMPKDTDQMDQNKLECEVNETFQDEADMNFSSLSWVGHVTGLHDGGIDVTWADGMISKVGPQAIYVVGREDGESFNGGSEISDDGASWETVEENDMATLDVACEDADDQPPAKNNVDGGNGSTNPSDHINPGRKEREPSLSDEDAIVNIESHDNHESPMRDSACDEPNSQESDVLDGQRAQNSGENGEVDSSLSVAAGILVKMGNSLGDDIPEEMDVDSNFQRVCDEHGSCSFKHFDIAKEPLDHHFFGGTEQVLCGRKWTKKVQKEWSILEKNLPDAIFVRVFEDRMDLLRAVIVGACGTPYQDGLFFFDFFLPSEYPQVPPSAYYHSGGLRINPNLYEEGKVCLSLLNTWTGKGNEVWDPNSSSILQVLVSIQGLVLNSRPYFNEAGYEKQVGTAEGEKNSYPYNENTYLLNLRSMLYLLRRPPMHFEDFVRDHFRSRGPYILKACDAYMNGCPVGSLTKDACMTTKSNEHSSVGFKLMLAKIIPKLFTVLSDAGADCTEFKHLSGSS